jgi:WD40 repeat protein/energy-coupling factor transporter ATP-binding protein EcfA2
MQYDVFLSHNSADKEAVESIARCLREEAQLEPFLDKWHLVPGKPWQEALEQALDASRACAVFLGPVGLGTWENEEMRTALDIRAGRPDYRVIPVLLPGARLPERGRLPRFLARHTWVDFRPGLDDADAFHRLVCGIQGIAPGPEGVTEAETVCPFRGLRVFDEEHARFFFGREALTQHLVEQLREDRFLTVIGPSGSGKSSLVRAGLVPQVREGALPASDCWPIVLFKPGPHPLETLAARVLPYLNGGADPWTARGSLLDALHKDERGLHGVVQVALAAAPDSLRLLVVVDQFEELFTLCHDENARSRFIANLLYASAIAGGQTVAVITMRADFFGKCAAYPELAARLAERDVLVGPMSEEELRQAMEGPAQAVGLHYEKGLLDTILDDLEDEPGTLPLLQHTLLELWERRRGGWLTTDAYHEIGGVKGALAQRADEIYARLTPTQQKAARRVLLRLTQPGEGTEDTRRRATLAELLPAEGEPADVEAAVRELADARLLTTGKDERDDEIVDVSHEALIRGWPRLREWIEEDRAGLRTHRRLTEVAIEWKRNHRDESFLYRGARLAEAREWAKAHADDMNPLEREFLNSSVSARKHAQIRRIAIGLVAILLVVGALALIAVQQRNFAVKAQRLALSASAQRALSDNNTDLAIALALEANNVDQPPGQARTALADAAYYAPGTRRRFEGHTDDVTSVAFSPDGSIILSGSADDSLRLWDIESGTEIRRFEGHTDDVTSVAFSPDGSIILSGSADDSLRLWDIESGMEIRRFEGHTDDVTSVAFSPNGRTILSGSADTSLRLWDIESGVEIRRFEGHTTEVYSVAFSPDGRQVASGSRDNEMCVWDVDTGENIRCISPAATQGVKSLAFNPDNRTVMVGAGGFGPGIYLWDINTGGLIRALAGHTGGHTQVAFNSDGQLAVSGSYDNSVILWDVDSGTETHRFIGHTGDIMSVAFSPDDRMILSGSADNSLRLWDAANRAEIRRFTGYIGMAVSPDGRTILSSPDGSRLVLLDAETGEVIRRFDGDTGGVTSLAFSPDGGSVFSGSWDGKLRLWDIERGKVFRILEGHPSGVNSIAISPDGRTALSGSYGPADPSDRDGWDRVLLLWDVKTGKPIHHFSGHGGIVRSVAFSSDGRTALSGSDDRSIRLWDVESGTEIVRFEGHTDKVTGVVFGPDGRTALSASRDQTIRLWDIETGQEIRRFTGHTSAVTSVALSPDGRTVLSGSDDFSIRLWDIETGTEIGRLTGHGQQVRGVTFRPDGRTAVSRSWDNTIRLWQIRPPDELIEWTYANRYVRELTCAERRQYGVEPFCDEKGGNLK